MATKNINLKKGTGVNKQLYAPNTTSANVADIARNQALSASLQSIVERNALGYPTFATSRAWAKDEVCFYDRKLWKFTSAHAINVAWGGSDVEEFSLKEVMDAIIANLENGTVIPALATNLESWEEDLSPVSNTWDETIRSTAGDDPIVTEGGGVIEMIRAKSDFKCTGLRTTAYNQLRLASNGGGAVAVGTGFYFPVPKLELGQFGDASYNNGLLLTNNNGENIQNATVYFKPLASGVPTSVTDGTACSYETVTFGGKTYRTYVTSGEGWLIVSGIDYANTCAHLAWEDWYDKFVSPTDAEDAGDYIALSALFAAAPNGTGKFLVVGNIATYAERTDETHMLITDPIGRVTSPSWTNTLQEDGETYLHSLTISGMKTDGVAAIEGSNQILIVSGTTVSYSDTNATAISGAVRYEKATPATATVTLGKTSYALNDCGVEVKEGAEGEGWMRCGYSQNIADALSQIAKFKLGDMAAVIAEALASHQAALTTIVKMLSGEIYIPNVKVQTLETLDETSYNVPKVLIGAGAPNANSIPENFPSTMAWTGVPLFPAQEYFDKTNNKWYKAKAILNNAVSDWLLLN